ncbi:hypothetical protein Calag_1444 [Caldisphaera lagunensis DSM 15908]|uniref:Ig-like domain-containing protein n=1 Tax=Caldisphaera lagunensis (strain DSM 15908 / JCM 11604 / ANMR 0165 / IC-154) TaxID=1056495 RepID=L0ACK3_CALLD|nr:hypothetical protein [Caldisphaera lagunensis]AFZ71149.1 hypothetical protein Calag_1444 [Caldisphaera lagunensis DSM 15908]
MGSELEKPNEPPSCKIKVYDGYIDIINILNEIKEKIYLYNTEISKKSYYLKPVHKVYKTKADKKKIIYEYYGRYWWKRINKKFIYSGIAKPKFLPNPPENPLEGLSIVREGNDVILDCSLYEKFKWIFKDRKVERTW